MSEAAVTSGSIPVFEGMTRERFEAEILPAGRPAVFRGLVAHWPAVREAHESAAALSAYLRRFDRGQSVDAMFGPPRIRGRFHYNDDLSGFNFRTESVKVGSALDYLLSRPEGDLASLAVQSVPVRENLTGFEQENVLPLLDESVQPRIWIGSAATIAAHHDGSDNIACVAAGRRRFTLFPPDQVANLYIGPFELTPAGPPISMVDFAAPDHDRFPRFAEAMAHSLTAELEPGDAIFIPYLWWHHVRATERFNVLVNYWWAPAMEGRPIDALFHAMLAMRNLPAPHRAAWRAMFEHYAFGPENPGEHLPADRRGVMGAMEPHLENQVRASIAKSMGRTR